MERFMVESHPEAQNLPLEADDLTALLPTVAAEDGRAAHSGLRAQLYVPNLQCRAKAAAPKPVRCMAQCSMHQLYSRPHTLNGPTYRHTSQAGCDTAMRDDMQLYCF